MSKTPKARTPKPVEKAPFVPAAFDPSLADLAHIKAVAVTTLADATADNHAMVTITMDSSTLQSILTAASLHYSDNPHVDKPVDPASAYADLSEQSNRQEQHWHWLMQDTIDVLSGRISSAVIPDRAQYDNKDTSVSNRRKHREMFDRMDREEAAKGADALADAALDESETPEALARWFKATKSKPMSEKELLNILINLRRAQSSLPWSDAMRLFSTASDEATQTKKLKEKVSFALAALK